MTFRISFDVDILEYDRNELQNWNAGQRDDCSDTFCRHLSGTAGFGEYIVGRHFETKGYEWIHHDFDLFGTNVEGKYPKSDSILMEYFGEQKLHSMRNLHKTFFPFREHRRHPLETPDLLIFKRSAQAISEVRFAESKRLDTRDKLNNRQALGLFLIEAVLKCPVQLFVIRERKSTKDVPKKLEFSFIKPALF